MNSDVLWFVGAPLVGSGVLAAGLVVPRLKRSDVTPMTTKDGARVLPLVVRRVDAPASMPPAPASGEELTDYGTALSATEHASRVDDDGSDAPAPTATDAAAADASVAPPSNVARPAFGVRIATGLKRAFRRPRASDAPSIVDALSADLHADAGTGDVEPAESVADQRHLESVPVAGAPPRPDAAPVVGLVPFVPAADDALPQPGENGIIAVEVPAGEDPEAWRASVAERERLLAAQEDEARRVRDASERDRQQRVAEADAHARQIELENIALAEEVRVRSEARARKWYARLDLDLEAPTIEHRMMLASSLSTVRAAWAGKLLREAFDQEEEARVRARVIGALVSGDHLDVPAPFVAAFDRGGIERAATFEMLMPRQHEAAWITDLLAPLLVA